MNENQIKMWEFLCGMSGEEVARAFTDYHGNQLLSDEFMEFLQEEYGMEGE